MCKSRPISEPELIKGCQRGDPQAQKQLYLEHYKTMFNISLRILNDTTEAEDVMQDSFIEAFSKIESYRGDGAFGGWLRRIVVNNSIDAFQKKKTLTGIEEENISEPLEYIDETHDHSEYQMAEIKKAFFKLSKNYRVILSLYLFEGYDHEEIAKILNISYGLSRTRYSRARKKLLEIIGENRFKSSLMNKN